MRLVFIFLLFLAACVNKRADQTPASADTTQVIELALKTALGQQFPEMDAVKRRSIFQDSILFTTSLFSIEKLPPRVDSFKFKIMPDTMICPLLKTDTISTELPNYLRLQAFQKTDTGYFVQFESVICIPSATRDASVGLHILRTKDKFVFEKNDTGASRP